MSEPTITILFPAFNEEAGIERAVLEAASCCEQLQSNGEVASARIVVVDDGSTDATPEHLRALQRRLRGLVTVVRHETNRGLGAAIRSGLSSVTTDLVFYTDADLPVDLSEVSTALDLLRSQDLDVVSAYRRSRRGEGPRRFLYSVVYNHLVDRIFRLGLRDVNFAAKLIRTSALRGVELQSEGSFVDVELLARLRRRGCRIGQFPVDYRPRSRGVSTLSSSVVIRTILNEMLELRRSITQERPRPT